MNYSHHSRVVFFLLLSPLVLPVQVPLVLLDCPEVAHGARDKRSQAETKSERKVKIERVLFEGPVSLSEENRSRLVRALQDEQFDVDSDWKSAVQDKARGVWQDAGYFTAEIMVRVESTHSEPAFHYASVVLHVEEGPLCRLGTLTFRSVGKAAPVVSESRLREIFPLQSGDIFTAQGVRDGLDAFLRAHAELGYVDFVAMPQTLLNRPSGRIDLLLQFDEGSQFHIGSVRALANPTMEELARDTFPSGTAFQNSRLKEFVSRNKPANVDVKRKRKTNMLDLTFDFSARPLTGKP